MNALAVFVGQLLFLAAVCGQKVHVPDEERRASHWEREGQKYLQASLLLPRKSSVARNVIFFLGDGMGVTTVTAMRIMKGQLKNKGGEDEKLVFDQFPFVSLSKTYGIDRQTSDSANTATAYLCGVKANYGTLGLDGRAVYENCSSAMDPTTHVKSILQWAQEEGKSTGFVTTTRVTHATPAGLFAHSASRNWEGYTPDPKCKDIASQLVEDQPGRDIKVIMGGGSKHFVPESENDKHGNPGARKDSRNLIEHWLKDKKSRNAEARAVYNAEELKVVDPKEMDYLIGLFDSDHLPYAADKTDKDKSPSLSEMMKVAVKILQKNPKGFFLLVEGGKIDIAHHQNWAKKALVEGVEFDKAVEYAVEATSEDDTLLVVTADHSHTFSFGGDYPLRGNNILGLGGVSDKDNKTFTTLGYYNGPGYKEDAREKNLTEEQVLDKEFQLDTALPMKYESHGGEDVAVYAKGPMAHLFHGVHDQSYIPYVMGYAACIGPNRDHCTSGAWSQLTSQHHWIYFLKLISIALTTYACSIKSWV